MCVMFVAVALFHGLLNSHGFGGNTYVRTSTEYIESIQQIVEQNSAQAVLSYHLNTQECHLHQILARAQSTTNCYFAINLDDYPAVDITCSPLQQFYLPEKNSWIPAHELQVGDILLTAREGSKPIVRITFVQQKLELYALKIACPHTFFVGRYSVLTHNMNLPVASLCWELPLTITTFSATGGILTGCVGAASGVAISAIAASLLYSAVMDYQSKSYHSVEIPRDTMVLFAQKQNNTSQQPSGGKNNPNRSPKPQDPNGKKPRCTDKVGNMHELLKREGFGEDLKQCSRATGEIDPHTRSRVYEVTKDMPKYGLKAGDKCYLDKLHKDHLEVFRGEKPYKVLNLDGSLNIKKTHAAAPRSYDAR